MRLKTVDSGTDAGVGKQRRAVVIEARSRVKQEESEGYTDRLRLDVFSMLSHLKTVKK